MKKIYIILIIIFNLLILGICLSSMFLFSINEYVYVLLSLLVLILNVILWKKDYKKISKIVVNIISFIFVLAGFGGTYCNPYWNSYNFRNANIVSNDYDNVYTEKEALSDLEYAMKYLRERHPVYYHDVSEKVESRYLEVVDEIKKKDKITTAYLEAEIESVFSLLGDAHTFAIAPYSTYHIMKDANKHNKNDEKLVKVNGIELRSLWHEKSNLFSYEMEEAGFQKFCDQLVLMEELIKMDIDVDKIVYTYSKDGEEKDYEYTKSDFLNQSEYYKYNDMKIEEEKKPFVRYEIDKDRDVVVLTLDDCINNDYYKDTLKKMFKEIKKNKINNVAVDLRENGGGNSSVATEFIKYLDVDSYLQWASDDRYGLISIKNKEKTIKNIKYNDLLFKGNVYVLTSMDTFSSAMNFAMYIKDNNIGKVIGEASENNPNSYGDIVYFLLPNSNIYVQISYKKWYRISTVKDEIFVEPNIKCDRADVMEKLYETIGEEK